MSRTLIETAAFDPEVTSLLGLAFDDAAARAGGDQYQREVIALRIIDAAKSGERDVHKLAEYGLNGQALDGQALDGQALDGQALNGQALNGQALNDQA